MVGGIISGAGDPCRSSPGSAGFDGRVFRDEPRDSFFTDDPLDDFPDDPLDSFFFLPDDSDDASALGVPPVDMMTEGEFRAEGVSRGGLVVN